MPQFAQMLEDQDVLLADGVVYPEDPESFAARLAQSAPQGANIVGGCCGSTPSHLAALAALAGRSADRPADAGSSAGAR